MSKLGKEEGVDWRFVQSRKEMETLFRTKKYFHLNKIAAE